MVEKAVAQQSPRPLLIFPEHIVKSIVVAPSPLIRPRGDNQRLAEWAGVPFSQS
jgi:hypothetical protein